MDDSRAEAWRWAHDVEEGGPRASRYGQLRLDKPLNQTDIGDCVDVADVTFRWRRTFPIFLLIVAASSVAIFNYQKMSSPVVSSTLYALRTNQEARDLLGDEIYFKHQIPWIHGEINQLHGRIDIWFSVRGTKGEGVMRFASNRPTSKGFFSTTEWSLAMSDGTRLDLLDNGDPFKALIGGGEDLPAVEEDAPTRGFRKQVEYK